MTLREPRPVGFLLFSSDMQVIAPAAAFLNEHAPQHEHTADTVRTYTEICYDWFDALEQSFIAWNDADAMNVVAYRNRQTNTLVTFTAFVRSTIAFVVY